ncbi:hypothetical protein pb186bvf_013562 [Paramecium bursaria]
MGQCCQIQQPVQTEIQPEIINQKSKETKEQPKTRPPSIRQFQFMGDVDEQIFDGHGKLKRDGEEYEGEFHDGNMFKGKYRKQDCTYYGDFVNNMQQGQGQETYSDGTVYLGQFYNGLKHGLGVLTFNNGEKYTGKFYEDQFDGYGEYEWEDGKIYYGTQSIFNQGQLSLIVWPDGKEFHCVYENGIRQGEGKFIWPDNKQFTGNWDNGQLHGKVRIEYNDYTSEGECQRDKIKWWT